jgi:hypothetical protein
LAELFTPEHVGLLALLKFRLSFCAEVLPGFVGKLGLASLLPKRTPRGIFGFALCAHLPPRVAQGEPFLAQLTFLRSA